MEITDIIQQVLPYVASPQGASFIAGLASGVLSRYIGLSSSPGGFVAPGASVAAVYQSPLQNYPVDIAFSTAGYGIGELLAKTLSK